ncbi:MAG TPA: MauE/DoxX family redox-associated membrane protein [Thermoanaerobaculia bacterium]|nr:MauE/DoxX family redox-associated membrane protein [Thermoanaerobaculia bacterium]
MKIVDRLSVGCLAAVFLFAGSDKIAHYHGFVNALRDYVLVPRGTAQWLASPLIALELMVGLGLLVPAWRRGAAITAASTLLLFTTALLVNQALGGRGICGCWFTITLSKSSGMHVVQNLVLLMMSLLIAVDSPKPAEQVGRLVTTN